MEDHLQKENGPILGLQSPLEKLLRETRRISLSIDNTEVSIRLVIRRIIQYTSTFEYFLFILCVPFIAGAYLYLTTKVSPLPLRTPVLGNAIKGPPITSVHKGNRGISSRRSIDFRSFQKYLVQHRVKTLDIYEHTSLYKNLVDNEYPHVERTAIIGYAGLSDETVATLTPILNSWLGLKNLGPQPTPYAWKGYKLIHPSLSEWCNQRLRLEHQYELCEPRVPYDPIWRDSQRQDYYRKFYTSHFRAQGLDFKIRRPQLRSWNEKINFKYLVENDSQWKSNLNDVKLNSLDYTELNTFQGVLLSSLKFKDVYSQRTKDILSFLEKTTGKTNLTIQNYKSSGDGIRDIWPRQSSHLHLITLDNKISPQSQILKDLEDSLGFDLVTRFNSWTDLLLQYKVLRYADYPSISKLRKSSHDNLNINTFINYIFDGKWNTRYADYKNSPIEFIAYFSEICARNIEYYLSYSQKALAGTVHHILREIFAYLPSYDIHYFSANQHNLYKASHYLDHALWPNHKPLWSKFSKLTNYMLNYGLEMDKVFPSSYIFFYPYSYAGLLQLPSHWRQRHEMSNLKPFILQHKKENSFVKNVSNHTITSNLRSPSIKSAYAKSKEQEYIFSAEALAFQQEVNKKQKEVYDVYATRNQQRIALSKERGARKHKKKVIKNRRNRIEDLMSVRKFSKIQKLNIQYVPRVYPLLRNYIHEYLIRFNDTYAWWYRYHNFESKFKANFIKNKDFHDFMYGNNPYEYIATYIGESRLKTLWTLGKTDKLINNRLLYKPYKNTLKNKKGVSIVGHNGNVKWDEIGKRLRKRGRSFSNGKATKLHYEFTQQPEVHFFVDNVNAGPNDLRSQLRLSLEVPKSVPYPLSSKRRPDRVDVPRSPYSALKRRLMPGNTNPRAVPAWWDNYRNKLARRPNQYHDEMGRQHRYLDKPIPEDVYLPWNLLAWDLHKKEVDSHMSADAIESFFGKWLEDDCLIHEAVEADILTSMENYLHFTFLGQFPKDMVNPVYRKYFGYRKRKTAKPKVYRMTKPHLYLSNNYRANFPKEVDEYLAYFLAKSPAELDAYLSDFQSKRENKNGNEEISNENNIGRPSENIGPEVPRDVDISLRESTANNSADVSSLPDHNGSIITNVVHSSEDNLSNNKLSSVRVDNGGDLTNGYSTNGEEDTEKGDFDLDIPSDFSENVRRTHQLPDKQLLLSVPDIKALSEYVSPLEVSKPSVQELYVSERAKHRISKGNYFISTNEDKIFNFFPTYGGDLLDTVTFDLDEYQLKNGFIDEEDLQQASMLDKWKDDFLSLVDPSEEKKNDLFKDLSSIHKNLSFNFDTRVKNDSLNDHNSLEEEDILDDLYKESDIKDLEDYRNEVQEEAEDAEHFVNVPYINKRGVYVQSNGDFIRGRRHRKRKKQFKKVNRIRSANERFMDSVYFSQIPTYDTSNDSDLYLNIDLFGNHRDIGALNVRGEVTSGDPELDSLADKGRWQLRNRAYSRRIIRTRIKNNKFGGGKVGYIPIDNIPEADRPKKHIITEAARPRFEGDEEKYGNLDQRRIRNHYEYIVRLPEERVSGRHHRVGVDAFHQKEPPVDGYPSTDYALITNSVGPISIQRGHGRTLMAKALPKVSTLYQYREAMMPIPYISPSEFGSIVNLITAQEDDTRKSVMMTNITIHEPIVTRILQTIWLLTALIFTFPYVWSVGMYISYYGKLFFLPILLSDNMPENLPDLIINTSQPTTRLKDIAGLKEEKQQGRELISFLAYSRRYRRMGAKIPRGILFLGEPGTGKTLLALAIAGESAVSFIWESGAHLLHKKKGIGAQRIKAIYKTARDKGRCIVFIDEIDAFAMQRSYETTKEEKNSKSWIKSLDLNTRQGMKRFNEEQDSISSNLPTDENEEIGIEESINELESLADQNIAVQNNDEEGKEVSTTDKDNKEEAIACLNQLLTEIDGIDSKKYTILTLAATNRGHLIDEALLRPGRIERNIVLGLPSLYDRTEIIDLYAKGLLAPDVDSYLLAVETPGISGGGIATIFGEAILNMAVAGEEELSLERVHEAMNHYYTPELKTVILGGYAEKTVVKDGIVSTVIDLDNLDVISPYTISLHVKDALGSARLRMDAYYWAGRALLSILLPNHEPLTRIDLKSKTRGAWIQFYSTKRYLLNRVDLRDHIIGYLGGIASQIYVYGETSSTSSEDLELATGIIRTMIKASGMSEIGVMPIEPEEYQQSPKLFYTKDPSWVENSNKLTNEGAYINDSLNSLVEDKIFEVSSLCIAEAIRLLNKYRLVLDIFAEDLVRKDVLYYSDMLLIMEELEKHNLTAEMQIPEKVNIII